MKHNDVLAHLTDNDVHFTVHEHEPHTTMEHVFQSGAFDMKNTLKALAFASDGQVFVAVVPGEARLHYGNFARACGVNRKSLRTLAPGEVVDLLGDIPGGVSPIQRTGVNVIFDEVVSAMGVISCGGGDPRHTISMEATDLIGVVSPRLAPIAQAQVEPA